MIPLNQQSAIRVVFLLTAILIFSYPLAAQLPVGLRAGISADPDQFFFGGHVESEPLIQTVRFRPSVEGGFGDHRTLLALNAEFVYPFDLDNDYTAYLGAGPAINVISSTETAPIQSAIRESNRDSTFWEDSSFPTICSRNCVSV